MTRDGPLVDLLPAVTRQRISTPLAPGSACVIGTEPGCDVQVSGTGVLGRHARLSWSNGDLVVEPLGRATVSVNGQPVTEPARLNAGDWLALGASVYQVQVASGTPTPASAAASPPSTLAASPLKITIGRLPDNDVSIPSPVISRRHARIVRDDRGWAIEDLESTNGTFVNGARVDRRLALRGGDRLEFGSFAYRFADGRLQKVEGAGAIHVEARALRKSVPDAATGKLKDLLVGIDLAIQPGEFVGIFGTSGSGKSTLMDALNGRRPASKGTVLYNGTDLYRSFGLFKSTIGYVPQQDIVHRKITIQRALAYTARLRLPEDTSGAEIDGYIARVLDRVGLSDKAKQPIDTPVPLSGGQLKRVSLAVELVSNPAILFLDEATSGLDAGTDKRMMHLFGDLAADGKTVICVTHTLENIDACHLVVVLFSGRLVYLGPPAGVLDHFGIRRLTDVYDTLESAASEHWAERYEKSAFHRDYVERRLSPTTAAPNGPGSLQVASSATPRRRLAWRQAGILIRRYVDLIVSDRRNLAILLAQAPVIGAVIGLVFDEGKTLQARADAESKVALMLVISAIWFGCLNSAREIVKELPVYARERSVNLRLAPYVLSKVVPLAVLCALQCVALLAVVSSLLSFPGDFTARAAALFFTGLAATAMGLTVSAFVVTTDKAAAIVPILLIPQVVLSDAVVRLSGTSQILAKATMISFWAFDCMKATLGADVREVVDQTGKLLLPVRGGYWSDLAVLALFFTAFIAMTVVGLRMRDRSG